MENSKSNFKALVAKMEQIKETEQGKLKGGISVLSSGSSISSAANYAFCGSNFSSCKTKK